METDCKRNLIKSTLRLRNIQRKITNAYIMEYAFQLNQLGVMPAQFSLMIQVTQINCWEKDFFLSTSCSVS